VLHNGMPYDPIQIQGQGHGGPNIAKIADFKVYRLRQYACKHKTKAHDTRSRNRRHESTPFFWRRCTCVMQISDRILLVAYQIPAPIRTLFYSKPESGEHVTEMMTCD